MDPLCLVIKTRQLFDFHTFNIIIFCLSSSSSFKFNLIENNQKNDELIFLNRFLVTRVLFYIIIIRRTPNET